MQQQIENNQRQIQYKLQSQSFQISHENKFGGNMNRKMSFWDTFFNYL